MLEFEYKTYNQIKDIPNDTKQIRIEDHIEGFNKYYKNDLLDILNSRDTSEKIEVWLEFYLPDVVKSNYPNLDIKFDIQNQEKINLQAMRGYQYTGNNAYDNFTCTLLGSMHVSRILLASIMSKSQLWNDDYCTKNFKFNWDQVDGIIMDYTGNKEHIYNKFFIDHSDMDKKIVSIDYDHCNTLHNIHAIEPLIKNSCITIVAEAVGESYVPAVTEKFLQNVVTKTLFLGYAQPGWHQTLKEQYGFKLYDNIFNYSFDKIKNPVYRLIRLMEMISKFRYLTRHDWHEMYLTEQDNIEYNYNHYYSKEYLTCLKQFDKSNNA